MNSILNIDILNETSNIPELSDKTTEKNNDNTLKKLQDEKRKLRCKATNKKRHDTDADYKEHKKKQSKDNYILLKQAKEHFIFSKKPLVL